MQEFDLINKFFYKLSKSPENLNLIDDAALIKAKDNSEHMLVSTDTIVEGSHFFNLSNPRSIANKLFQSNLSDIAAMGAVPKYWLLSISIPKNHALINTQWFSSFSNELSKMQKQANCYLIGGDVTSSKHNMVLTATVIGYTEHGLPPLLKSQAKNGDYICVTGTLGDAYVGFNVLNKQINNINSEIDFSGVSKNILNKIANQYYFYKADIEYAPILIKYANSCSDISDGIIADLSKICMFSNVCGEIDLSNIPLSKVSKKFLNNEELLIKALTWGDDYKLVFTIPKHKFIGLQNELELYKLKIYKIGTIYKNSKVGKLNVYNNKKLVKITNKGNIHNF